MRSHQQVISCINEKAEKELDAFLHSIGLTRIYESVKSAAAQISDNYRNRALIELIQNGYDAHPRGRINGQIALLLDETEKKHGCQRTQKRLSRLDRTFWILLYRIWPRCLDAVVIVKPETVIRWHGKGFRLFWTWRSRPRVRGRPPVPADIKNLIRRMSRENPLWGAPQIHGELLKLGIEISQAAVSKYLVSIPNCRRRAGEHSSGTMGAV